MFRDTVLGRHICLSPDYLVLSSAIRSDPHSAPLVSRLKIPQDGDGFFLEAHLKLRPLDFASEGMFLCGLAQSPKMIEETIAQARGAAARAATVLSKDFLQVGGVVAQVDEEKCATCLTCVRVCPFDVPVIRDRAAYIDNAKCQGCGSCAAACPARAIQVGHYRDEQVIAKVY
jgi:heterodisulfide reductase subunit A-like polyferredoxin